MLLISLCSIGSNTHNILNEYIMTKKEYYLVTKRTQTNFSLWLPLLFFSFQMVNNLYLLTNIKSINY
ncbi:unnamed protein product [Schistosoma rodhaini]|uniref:Uncharacterized protein n=1 Tax=Schistosoma rodhaini TaxID=6188 RepID=A0AA85FZ33_9TREM|nr:unnamed protein product [Schistosoma rodhaini]